MYSANAGLPLNFLLPTLTGYNTFSTEINYNQNDGVVVFVAEHLKCKVYEPKNMVDCNCLVVTLDDKITIICIYRSPSYSNVSGFLDSLDKLIRNIKTKSIVITGDINIDTLSPSVNDTSDYLELLASHGLIQGISVVTRPKSQTCLDHFMGRCQFDWETIVYENTNITDHSPILFLAKYAESCHKANTPKSRIKVNYDAVKSYLEESSWSEFYNSCDANWCANFLIDKLKYGISKFSKTIKTAPKRNPLKPWITVGVIRSLSKRNKIHKALKKCYSDDLNSHYVTYRNWCSKIVKTLKQ